MSTRQGRVQDFCGERGFTCIKGVGFADFISFFLKYPMKMKYFGLLERFCGTLKVSIDNVSHFAIALFHSQRDVIIIGKHYAPFHQGFAYKKFAKITTFMDRNII